MNPSEISVFVIGNSPYRAASLHSLLEEARGTAIPAVSIDPAEVDHYVDQSLAETIYGRKLTLNEVACAIAHRRAYSLADLQEPEWALILEDDAGAPRDLLNLLADLPLEMLGASPAVVSLYSTSFVHWGHHLRRSRVLRLLVPPSHAVAYLINRRAWRQALASPDKVIATADWPPWALSVDFYCLDPPVTIHHTGPSTILNRDAMSSIGKMKRVRAFLSDSAYRQGRAYFSNRRGLLKWYFIAPVRRMLGHPGPSRGTKSWGH